MNCWVVFERSYSNLRQRLAATLARTGVKGERLDGSHWLRSNYRREYQSKLSPQWSLVRRAMTRICWGSFRWDDQRSPCQQTDINTLHQVLFEHFYRNNRNSSTGVFLWLFYFSSLIYAFETNISLRSFIEAFARLRICYMMQAALANQTARYIAILL